MKQKLKTNESRPFIYNNSFLEKQIDGLEEDYNGYKRNDRCKL